MLIIKPMLPSILTAVFLAAAATAQCTCQGATALHYGSGCNAVVPNPPSLAVAFDVNSCTLDITLQASGGCCNTYLNMEMLAIGALPSSTPLPQIGVGCQLLASPDAVMFQVPGGGGNFPLVVPPIAMPFTFFAQGGALYFTTIGLSYTLALTDGEQITLN